MVVLAGGMKWGRLFPEFDLSVRNTMTIATATGSRKMQHHDAHWSSSSPHTYNSLGHNSRNHLQKHPDTPSIHTVPALPRSLHESHSVHRPAKYFQLGLHFRCGDKIFLMQVSIPTLSFPFLFFFDVDNHNPNYLKSLPFAHGTPVEIAECATKVLGNHSHSAVSSARE